MQMHSTNLDVVIVMGNMVCQKIIRITKALELFVRAGELGCATAFPILALTILNGVERDKKKAEYYLELAAMEGNSYARCNLGANEYEAENYDRALKHYTIAVRAGDTDSVKEIQDMYMDGHATKDHYANALRSHQAYLNEIKSDQRDKAATLHDDCRYY